MDKKILFLGLDAAMPDLVKKFVGEGVMPNTAKLMEQGVFSRLETVFPPLTAAAWCPAKLCGTWGKNWGKRWPSSTGR